MSLETLSLVYVVMMMVMLMLFFHCLLLHKSYAIVIKKRMCSARNICSLVVIFAKIRIIFQKKTTHNEKIHI